MDAVKIKICGLMRPEDIDAVNEYRPDLAGFILARGRRRSLTDQQMRELVRALRPEIQSAAVFLDQDVSLRRDDRSVAHLIQVPPDQVPDAV